MVGVVTGVATEDVVTGVKTEDVITGVATVDVVVNCVRSKVGESSFASLTFVRFSVSSVASGTDCCFQKVDRAFGTIPTRTLKPG